MRNGLDVLAFDQLRAEHPERYEKADLAGTSAIEKARGRWAVRRDGGDDAHMVDLVTAMGHPLGSCTCEGYSGGEDHPGHDGPCSHLAAVWRMEHADLLTIPDARPTSMDVEVIGEDQTLSAAVDQAVATDGGRRGERR